MSQSSVTQPARKATTQFTTTSAGRTAPKMDVRTVPLDSLALDPGNVRKTAASDSATAELAASIAAVGLITPLGCFETIKADKDRADTPAFSVVAGGRRLAAPLL